MKKRHPVVICVSEPTARLQYICDWIFNERLSLSYCIVTAQDAKSFQEVTFAYGLDLPEAAWRIHPSGWLTRSYFTDQKPGLELHENKVIPTWEPTSERKLPDIFGAIFWALTRAEEYGGPADQHGRFPAKSSWAFHHHQLDVPWVDHWINWLADVLDGERPGGSPLFRSSLDIDDAYAFTGRGLRAVGGVLKDLANRRWSLFNARWQWIFGGPDPFDQYEEIDRWLGDIKKNTHIFFLLSDNGHPLDHNIHPENAAIKQLIRNWAADTHTGIHPSYRAMENPVLIEREKGCLEEITGATVTDARFHYLRFRLPASYRDLISAGILADHSMAFSDASGFRAGTGHPFFWYDLEKEERTVLRVYPYCLMDRTLRDYLGLSPEQALERVRAIKASCSEAGIPLSWIWHNSTMGSIEGWEKYEIVRNLLTPAE